VLLVLALVTPGRAAEPARDGRIALAVSTCATSFEASLRQILVIELGDLLEQDRVVEGAEGESIEIACDAETARIVARGAGGEVVHHDLRLDTFPGDAAPRAVALAALEALRAVDPTLADRIEARRTMAKESPPVAPAKAPRPAPRPAPEPRVRSTGDAPRGFTRVLSGALVRWFHGDPSTLVGGARLELSRRFVSPWDVGLELDGTFARRTVALGVVEARLLSSAAWLGVRGGSSAWSATGGVGGRLGIALLSGAPRGSENRGHRSTRPWGGPMLLLRTDAAVGALALALGLEGGLVAAGAEGLAGGRPAIGFTSGWASASASVGFRY
jgi:hypothetical protein